MHLNAGSRVICLDTDVLVRLLVDDDEEQSGLAHEPAPTLTPATPAFVPWVVWVASYWVLQRALGWSSPETLLGATGTAPKTAMRRARRSGTQHPALVGGPQQPFVGVGAHRADFAPTATNR